MLFVKFAGQILQFSLYPVNAGVFRDLIWMWGWYIREFSCSERGGGGGGGGYLFQKALANWSLPWLLQVNGCSYESTKMYLNVQ